MKSDTVNDTLINKPMAILEILMLNSGFPYSLFLRNPGTDKYWMETNELQSSQLA